MDFIDLAAQQGRIRERIEHKIKNVLDHGRYINGPEVRELEERLAEYVGVKYAVGCSSGTDALLMPLMAYDIGPGDAVFTSAFTFIATAEVIQLLRATPVFVDIEPGTFNIDAAKLQEAVEETVKRGQLKPRGVIPVDLFGQPADYDEINDLAERHDLFVLEDAAQAFGACYKGRKACSLAGVAATSFFPAKPLGCYGDGGMIFTENEDLHERLVSIRDHGQGSNKYDNVRIGVNGRIDTIQAAVLLAKFELLDEEIELRQEIARRYGDGLRDSVEVPFVKDLNISAWAQYSIKHRDRDSIHERLTENNIPTAIYYTKPLHLQQAFAHLGYAVGDFPVSESVANEILSLPMHPYLGNDDQDRIIRIIRESV
jgi:UDP-2-acetamido-2-deoxy-ribo-hexuluronate aminotransferase